MERSADWLAQAQADLAAARHMLSAGFNEWACFAAQQAAEKAAKAALQRAGRDAWGHSVAALLLALRELATVPDPLVDAALELDKAYIGTRYPDVHPAGAPRTRSTPGARRSGVSAMRSGSSDSVRIWSPHSSRDELIAHLRARVRELTRELPLRRVVLFGSWARGRATARSDVDVLVIYADPPRADAYALVWRALQTPGLEPHVYAESEAVAIQGTLDRMAMGGIDLLADSAPAGS